MARNQPPPHGVSVQYNWLFLFTDYCTLFIDTCGSCSMLPRDKGGVVSPELKVYGTGNIRVADLSIVPLHVAAHTQGKPSVLVHCIGCRNGADLDICD